jgi:hypothetical protein
VPKESCTLMPKRRPSDAVHKSSFGLGYVWTTWCGAFVI